jgi:hypothetical protein
VDRVRTAFTIPIVVFSAAAAIAIGVGYFLKWVHAIGHSMPNHDFGVLLTPLVALVMVIVVTAAGFIASGKAGPEPEQDHGHHA